MIALPAEPIVVPYVTRPRARLGGGDTTAINPMRLSACERPTPRDIAADPWSKAG